MSNNQYGILYFEEKILGYDKNEKPILRGDFVIKYSNLLSDDDVKWNEIVGRQRFNEFKKNNTENKLITNISFVEILTKKGYIGDIVYINKIK